MPPPQKATVIFSSVPQSSRSEQLRSALSTAVHHDDTPDSDQAFSTPSSIPDEVNSSLDDSTSEQAPDYQIPPAPDLRAPELRAPELRADIVIEPVQHITEKTRPNTRHTDTEIGRKISSKNLGDDVISELKSFNGMSPLKSRRGLSDPSHQEVEQMTADLSEDDDRDYLKEIPKVDSLGREIPAWRRQLLARKLADQTKQERKEQYEREKEERRLAKMPRWKRELEARRSHDGKNSIKQ